MCGTTASVSSLRSLTPLSCHSTNKPSCVVHMLLCAAHCVCCVCRHPFGADNPTFVISCDDSSSTSDTTSSAVKSSSGLGLACLTSKQVKHIASFLFDSSTGSSNNAAAAATAPPVAGVAGRLQVGAGSSAAASNSDGVAIIADSTVSTTSAADSSSSDQTTKRRGSMKRRRVPPPHIQLGEAIDKQLCFWAATSIAVLGGQAPQGPELALAALTVAMRETHR